MNRNERDMLEKDEYAAMKKHPIARNPILLSIVLGVILIFGLGIYLVLRG